MRGCTTTSTSSKPAAANKPTIAGLSTVPASMITSPAVHSCAGGRISWFFKTAPVSCVPSTCATSQRITPKVFSGITAPVAIPTACPASNASFIGRPALTSPTICHGPEPATA